MLPDYSAASQSDLWAVTKPNGTFLDFLTLPGAIPLLEWTGGQYTWRLRIVTPNPNIFIEHVYASRMTPDFSVTGLGNI